MSPDFCALNSLWERTQTTLSGEGAPEDSKDQAPGEDSVCLRLITFFHLSTTRDRRIPCCAYERYELKLYPMSPFICEDGTASCEQRVLVVGTPRAQAQSLQGEATGPDVHVKLEEESSRAEKEPICAASPGGCEERPMEQREEPPTRALSGLATRATLLHLNGVFGLENLAPLTKTDRNDTVISGGQLRAAVSDSSGVRRDELSLLQRLSGATLWCARALADWTYRFLQMHFEVLLDDDDEVVRLRVHYRLRVCLAIGTFQTPWRLTANVRIDGTPCEYLNGRSRSPAGEYHMPILCLGDVAMDAEEERPSTDHVAGDEPRAGRERAPPSITIARFHCTPASLSRRSDSAAGADACAGMSAADSPAGRSLLLAPSRLD